jgi:hypothetical protein
MKNAFFDSFKVLEGSIAELVSNKSASAFLSKEVKKEQCIRDHFDAYIDAQIKGGNVEIEENRVAFATGSAIEAKGSLSSDLAVNMRGNFVAGDK